MVHGLEVATEKWKIASKIIFFMEVLKQEPKMPIPVSSLEQYCKQINLPKPHKIFDFLCKTPKLSNYTRIRKSDDYDGRTLLSSNPKPPLNRSFLTFGPFSPGSRFSDLVIDDGIKVSKDVRSGTTFKVDVGGK
ncbi:hypothetical protein RJT34_30457 [Clitoria ternatea]|uniref:Uncharacterized protein n=1 Tax=Clitoria ternatea TaxID=43366 RepID=A0AAN9EUL7_CLITE